MGIQESRKTEMLKHLNNVDADFYIAKTHRERCVLGMIN